MAPLQSLPMELLAHILLLSTEGETAKERQRARHAFALVARGCYLATPAATDFYVVGNFRAKALATKLEREKKWAAQDGRNARSKGRATRSSTLDVLRVSDVRRLSLVLDHRMGIDGFVDLLRATPTLSALELDATRHASPAARFIQLEPALIKLVRLRELRLYGKLEEGSILRILTPLKSLEVLDLPTQDYIWRKTPDWGSFALPHLRQLRITLQSQTGDFANTLLSSTPGIKILDLSSTPFRTIYSDLLPPLIPTFANVVHLSWDSNASEPIRSTRDAVLVLLGGMTNLQTISIAMWALGGIVAGPADERPIDPSLFDTLATLPSLHTVKLTIKEGRLNPTHLISFIESHTILRSVSLSFARTPSWWNGEQRGRIEVAAERAGVAFTG